MTEDFINKNPTVVLSHNDTIVGFYALCIGEIINH